MENENLEKNIFIRLKEIRQEKNIRLEQISEKSRIQLKYLRAMEEGDLLEIPAVYDKLFFKSYIKTLGVENQDELFEEFLKERQKIRIDKTTTLIQFTPDKTDVKSSIFSHRVLFVGLPSVLVVIVLGLLLFNTEIIGPSAEVKVQEIDIKNIVSRLEAEEKAKIDSISITQKDTLITDQSSLSLKINAQTTTWFRVVSDKRDTNEYLLKQGQGITLNASRYFEFLIGRADGLKLNLNGQNLEKLGPDSAVVSYLLIDSKGVAVKRLKLPKELKKHAKPGSDDNL